MGARAAGSVAQGPGIGQCVEGKGCGRNLIAEDDFELEELFQSAT